MASRHLVGVWPERLPQKPSCEDGPGKGKLRGGPAGRESTEADPRQSALHSLSLQVHLACRHTQRRLLPVQPPHHWLLPAGGVGRRHRPAGGWDHRSDLTPENLRSDVCELTWSLACRLYSDVYLGQEIRDGCQIHWNPGGSGWVRLLRFTLASWQKTIWKADFISQILNVIENDIKILLWSRIEKTNQTFMSHNFTGLKTQYFDLLFKRRNVLKMRTDGAFSEVLGYFRIESVPIF